MLGAWSFDWIISDLFPPKEYFSEEIYPKVYRWRDRFREELKSARSRAPKPIRLNGTDAVSAILDADFSDRELSIDPGDPVKLEEGAYIELYPTDGGRFTHQDRGRLVKLTKDEVAIAVRSEIGDTEVHVHSGRWNFRIVEANESRL